MIQHTTNSTSEKLAPSGRSWGRALNLARRKHFSPYKFYVRRDLQMAVVLNPKVGSTTFRRALVEGMQEAGLPPMLGRLWPLPVSRRYFFGPPRDYFDVLSRPQGYEFHCFVRNPYARLLSAWKDKFTLDERGKPLARSMKAELPVVRHFAQHHGLPGAAVGSAVPFETFLAYVEAGVEGARNHHWDTQCSVLVTDAITYDHVYPMETNFAEGMTRIFTRIGLPADWIERRVNTPRNVSRKLNEPVYTAALAERVHRLYRDDFELFGYDPESWQGQ